MKLRVFTAFNALGGLTWTALFVGVGYFFGTQEWVQKNFSLVVLALIVVPSIPAAIGFLVSRKKNPKT